MFSRISKTRILLFLSFALAIGVAGFVFGPSLYPRADARESGPTVEGNASCNATFTGIIMHRFEDGSVLFRFGEGHKVRVAPPSDDAPRNAVLLYKDGTARVQDFEPGTEVRTMPTETPKADEWYDPYGKPRSEPSQGEYPELWPRILEEFYGQSEPDHPWGDDWEEIVPPGTIADEEIFGPRISEIDTPDYWIIEHEDGTIRMWDKKVASGADITYANGNRRIRARWEGGRMDYQWWIEEDEMPSWAGCPNVGGAPYYKRQYPDGTIREAYYPKGTHPSNLHESEPLCERWLDSDRNEIDRPDPDKYPVEPIKPISDGMLEFARQHGYEVSAY